MSSIDPCQTQRSRQPAKRTQTFADAARLQAIVIGALMMREVHTRYGRDNLGIAWLVVEPLMFCTGIIALWSAIHGRYERGVPVLAFAITGYLPLTMWRHVTARAVLCFRSNASLLYHRQVRLIDLLLARVILEIYGSVIAYVALAFIFFSFGMYELPKDWGLFYLGWFYFILFVTGMGLILGAITEMYEWVEKLVGPLMYLLLPASGVFFMVDWLPARAQRVALYVPMVNAYEMIRGGQFGSSVHVYYSLINETFICAGLISLGLILCRNVHRHLVIE